MLQIILLMCAGLAVVQGNCGICPQRPLIYDELNCTGVYRPGDCCPTSFICPDWTKTDKSKCMYKGNAYDIGHQLSIETSDVPCMCTRESNMPAEWACTHIDCPEFLGGKPLHSGCRHAYTPKIFCATGEICPEDVSTLHVCHYRGVKAVKGERFVSPTDPCIQCTCTENFQDNIFVWSEVNAKNCARFNCGYETLYKDKVHANCAPVYFGEDSCCPIDWICPDEVGTTRIIPTDRPSTLPVCKFGDFTVKHLEGIETDDKCRKCTCIVPPYLTCTQRRHCQ